MLEVKFDLKLKRFNQLKSTLSLLCLLGLGNKGFWESTNIKLKLTWKQI